ncbi:MAG: sigma-70 family RNA polymerase sigma factor [Lachnospiraceae bacterium]|nr:sigma-70 family RNA polymerase sigma factor [Lachnospiraceae bacterium]
MQDDANFIIEIKNRNEEALCYIIEQYGGLVRSVIGKHLYLLAEEQEECFDDVFLNIWDHIDSFDEKRSTFINWIAGIARYKSIDYLRRYRKQFENVTLTEDIAVEDNELLHLIDREISGETEAILQCLKPEDRNLFEKLYIEEMTIDDVCESFQTNPNVIYKRLSRARKSMRERFPKKVT